MRILYLHNIFTTKAFSVSKTQKGEILVFCTQRYIIMFLTLHVEL